MNTKNDQVHGIKADGLTKRDKAVMDKAQKTTGLQKDDKFIKVPDGLRPSPWRPKVKKLTAQGKEADGL